MLYTEKRNGELVKFEIEKIQYAITKAFIATDSEEISVPISQTLALRTLANIKKMHKIRTKRVKGELINFVSVEDIQDSVEYILQTTGFTDEAKQYIVYRSKHADIRNGIDAAVLTEKYVKATDWRVKENSTVNYSLGGLILSNSGAVTADYWLNTLYTEEIGDAHKGCYMHIHDLSMLSAYCCGWSLTQLIKEGLGGVPGKISSAPASHLSTLCNQIVNFFGILQNEAAGAQAMSSFDTLLAPFVKADNLSYQQVKQCIQAFAFGVNTPSRWGSQAPFTNITLDWTCPADLKDKPAIVGGKEQDFTYGDCVKEMEMVNKAFIEVMIEGDSMGRGLSYPIPTYSITKDFDWSDTENNRLLFEMTAKYGTPYFSNYINSDMEPSDVRSMCCRLRLDLRELRRKNGGYFGSGDSTGSIGVVTLNLPRYSYLSNSEEEFFTILDKYCDLAAASLKIKRTEITKLLEQGLYPYIKRYLGSFDNYFSTIGVVGMNEAGLNAKWLKKDMTHKETQEWAKRILNHIRERLSDYQEAYGDLYNLEATPAESTSYRFAIHDKKDFPDIVTSGTEESPYYTNSTNLPVGFTDNVFEALDIQDQLQPLYTSGTVFHTFLGERMNDWRACAHLVKTIASNYTLPYYSISPVYSVCPEHGYLNGEQQVCPKCGAVTEVYSRITGYYRPVQNWNVGKTQEHKERQYYKAGPEAKSFADQAYVAYKDIVKDIYKDEKPFEKPEQMHMDSEMKKPGEINIKDALVTPKYNVNTPDSSFKEWETAHPSKKILGVDTAKDVSQGETHVIIASHPDTVAGKLEDFTPETEESYECESCKIDYDSEENKVEESNEYNSEKEIIIFVKDRCPDCETLKKAIEDGKYQYINLPIRYVKFSKETKQTFAEYNITRTPSVLVEGAVRYGLDGSKNILNWFNKKCSAANKDNSPLVVITIPMEAIDATSMEILNGAGNAHLKSYTVVVGDKFAFHYKGKETIYSSFSSLVHRIEEY